MSTPYYTLLVRHENDAPWSIEFGSYFRTEVTEERAVYRIDYDIPKFRTMVIKTDDKQASINAEVNRQNELLVQQGLIGDFNPFPI